MPAFVRTIGIGYSGAETPTASLNGLRVYPAEGYAPPVEALPQPSARKYCTRKGIAEWLVEVGALPSDYRNCPSCFPLLPRATNRVRITPGAQAESLSFPIC